MAAKVIMGKSTNTNLGHSGGKWGIWIARHGEEDVTTCTKDQLTLSTDTFGNASGAIDIGQFQVIPTSGTTASQEISISASQTITVSYVDQSTSNNFVQPYFSYGEYSSTGSNVSQYMQAAGYGGTSSVSMSNSGGNAITGTVTTWRGFSSSALF